MKLFLLPGGLLDTDRSVIIPTDDSGRRVLLPIMQVLVWSSDSKVLIDTGLPEAAFTRPQILEQYGWQPRQIRAIVSPELTLRAQLGRLRLSPADLDIVVNTHLHLDHAGQNSVFAGKTISLQEPEIRAAMDSEGTRPWDAPGLQFETFNGDWQPAPNVKMIATAGHSPGHQSLLVEMPQRAWLFTFDAVYTEEHWRENKLGASSDVFKARQSLRRLKEIADRGNVRVVFGHDIAQWDALGMTDRREPLLLDED